MNRTREHGFGRRHSKQANGGMQSPRYYTPQQSPRQSPMQTLQKPLKLRGSVRLGGVEIRGTVQYFAVDVFPGNAGAPWRVMRRYNHFRDLADKLGACNVPAPFPGKLWGDCEGSQLERRRQGLETWLSQAITSSRQHQHWIPLLRSFLERSAYRPPKLKAEMLGPIQGAVGPGPEVTPQESVDRQDSSVGELPFGPALEHMLQALPAQKWIRATPKSRAQTMRPGNLLVVQEIEESEVRASEIAK